MVTEDDVRRLALTLPETTEKSMYGTPAFYVRGKWFARIREEGDVLVLPVPAEEDKAGLIAAEPAKFFTTPHYDGHAIVLARFGAVDAEEMGELLTEAWRLRAPKRLAAEFDARA
ncbi:MmcQ/YjbR family DNA-binding protein [Nonomuraea sp. B1E8]|uniref:MmcQ/YjbR family DNA-binding protein n=1 Tax=unclassified Nonomuraea TaxID=2593643 RepID=UPI00325F679D